MPEKLKRQLQKSAKKKGLRGKHIDAYVYGALKNLGWESKKEKGKK